MSTEYGNIDDVLMSGKTATQPETPEHQYREEVEDDLDVGTDIGTNDYEPEPDDDRQQDESSDDEPEPEEPKDLDDYGNEKAKPRTYSEDEVNERINKAIRERLARGNNQQQQPAAAQSVHQQTQQGFEYDPEGQGNWQQQLEMFVEQTVSKMSQKQATQQQQNREAQAQEEFVGRFTQGMDKFSDFREVVGAQPVTDSMTMALRGMKDPASFIYAASKRNPKELARISAIPDHVAQIVEMGKLEERMRKAAAGTKAPKPISRTKEDAGMPHKDKNAAPSIEDLIAKSDARKLALVKQRRGR